MVLFGHIFEGFAGLFLLWLTVSIIRDGLKNGFFPMNEDQR